MTRWLEFYKHESCGKCTPCREGTCWIAGTLEKFEAGHGSEHELGMLEEICGQILGRSFCALGDAAATPFPAALKHFPTSSSPGRTLPADVAFDPAAATVLPAGAQRDDRHQPARHRDGHDGHSRRGPGRAAPAALPPVDHVTVAIDGIDIVVPKGTLIIRAAEQLGIEVPRFCDHPLLEPGRRLSRLPHRDRGPAQAAAGVRDPRRRRHEGAHLGDLRDGRHRPARASWSSC